MHNCKLLVLETLKKQTSMCEGKVRHKQMLAQVGYYFLFKAFQMLMVNASSLQTRTIQGLPEYNKSCAKSSESVGT